MIASLLSTPKEVLWPLIFNKDQTLKSEVRTFLLDLILTELQKYSLKLELEDALLYGSSVTYQYDINPNLKMDLDVSIYLNFNGVDPKEVQTYFKAKEYEYMGFPVHLYAKLPEQSEEVNEVSDGVYDIIVNRWIKKPIKETEDPLVKYAKELKIADKEVDKLLYLLGLRDKWEKEYIRYKDELFNPLLSEETSLKLFRLSCLKEELDDFLIDHIDTLRERRKLLHIGLECEIFENQSRHQFIEILIKRLSDFGIIQRIDVLKNS